MHEMIDLKGIEKEEIGASPANYTSPVPNTDTDGGPAKVATELAARGHVCDSPGRTEARGICRAKLTARPCQPSHFRWQSLLGLGNTGVFTGALAAPRPLATAPEMSRPEFHKIIVRAAEPPPQKKS